MADAYQPTEAGRVSGLYPVTDSLDEIPVYSKEQSTNNAGNGAGGGGGSPKTKKSGAGEGSKNKATNSESIAEKESITQTKYTIEGSLSINPNTTNFGLQARANVYLGGFGAYLSGNYYVDEVVFRLGMSGFEIEAKVSRDGTGPSVVQGGVATASQGSQLYSGTMQPIRQKELGNGVVG